MLLHCVPKISFWSDGDINRRPSSAIYFSYSFYLCCITLVLFFHLIFQIYQKKNWKLMSIILSNSILVICAMRDFSKSELDVLLNSKLEVDQLLGNYLCWDVLCLSYLDFRLTLKNVVLVIFPLFHNSQSRDCCTFCFSHDPWIHMVNGAKC